MTRQPAPVPFDLIAGLGGAAVLVAVLLVSRGGVTAGVVVGGLAGFGLLARWTSAPPLVLMATAYFGLFPDGLPVEPRSDGGTAAGPHLLDLLAAGAAVVYASGHYRLLAREGQDPPADDLVWVVGVAAAATLFGQAALTLVTRVRPDFARGPLRFVVVTGDETGEHMFARFLMLTGLLGFGAVLAGMGLWLARLNRLSAEEARLLLLDVQWREGRREFARLETWRAAALAGPVVRTPGRFRWVGLGCGLMLATFVVTLVVLRRR